MTSQLSALHSRARRADIRIRRNPVRPTIVFEDRKARAKRHSCRGPWRAE